jgi:hypothetical protein
MYFIISFFNYKMISTIGESNSQLPKEFQPNPLMHSKEYRQLNQDVQLKNNVNEGAGVWCHADQELDYQTVSLNQKLTGLANPKTLVQPMISMPIYDNDLWKSNDFMVPRGVNDQRRQELWQNGYVIDDITKFVRENYKPNDRQTCMQSSDLSNHRNDRVNPAPGTLPSYSSFNQQQPFLTEFGYYPNNLKNNIPTNIPVGHCEENPDLFNYNKNIYTSTIQPGVYSTSQVNQPDTMMQNMGISYTQPFLPTYSSLVNRKDDVSSDGTMYTQYEPEFAPKYHCNDPSNKSIPEDTIYDPRFTGYGTSYRSYVDELTGQPRFFYDDIDVHRRNKFITRNKIDWEPFGLQNGPQDHSPYTNMEIREMTQNAFLDNSLSHRTDLQERLMRKSNARSWQQKKMPIMTNQFTRGASTGAKGAFPSGYAGPRG